MNWITFDLPVSTRLHSEFPCGGFLRKKTNLQSVEIRGGRQDLLRLWSSAGSTITVGQTLEFSSCVCSKTVVSFNPSHVLSVCCHLTAQLFLSLSESGFGFQKMCENRRAASQQFNNTPDVKMYITVSRYMTVLFFFMHNQVHTAFSAGWERNYSLL